MKKGEKKKQLEIMPELAHELIYGSIEYAARWGFRPHADFKLAQGVLDPAAEHPLRGQVQFGHEGKPLYVAGPHDDAQAIMHQLAHTAGDGNFDYIMRLDEPPFDLLPDDDEQKEE